VLAVGGLLDLCCATIDFSDVGTVPPDQVYVFATYGSLSCDPATETNVPTGYHIDYNYLGGNEIALVPEPATLVLLAGLLMGVLLVRRRK